MAETFSPFDATKYLKSEEAIAEYLSACAEDNDPSAMVLALGNVARARNMSALARDTGLTREGIYKALSPTGNPSFATVSKVASAMGLQVVFQPVAAAKKESRRKAADAEFMPSESITPVNAEAAVAMMRVAIAEANSACESLAHAVEQAVELAEANMAVAGNTKPAKGTRPAHRSSKANRTVQD